MRGPPDSQVNRAESNKLRIGTAFERHFAGALMSNPSSIGMIKLLVLLALLTYLGLMIFAAVFANFLIFPAPRAGYRDSPDIIKFPYNGKGEAVSMVLLPNPQSPYLIFYHHGNGEDLQSIIPRLQALRKAGFAVLAWDYPGYGTSDGRPTARRVNEIAEKIWLRIPELTGYPEERVLLYGRSLGSGPATLLANRHQAAGLILEGSFTSILRVSLGINFLPWDYFDNLSLIRLVKCPVLVIHGTKDEVVPFKHGVRLHEAAPQPKFFTWIDGGRHNDFLESYPDIYLDSLQRFTRFISHH